MNNARMNNLNLEQMTTDQKLDWIIAALVSQDARITDLGMQMTGLENRLLDKIKSLYDLWDEHLERVGTLETRLNKMGNYRMRYEELNDRVAALETKAS